LDITKRQIGFLLVSLLVIALCGIVYELIIGAISSYLLGDSVYQFSITIGLFMFAMGIGSMLTKYFSDRFIENFIRVELAIAFFGGLSGIAMFVVFPYARVIYETTMYSFILVIGALLGMEIPILTGLLSEIKSAKQSIAEVLSFDYLGALVGSVAFPLLLLPSLGLIQSSFVIGSLNAFVALFTVITFKSYLKNYNRYMIAVFTVIGILLVCVIMGTRITSFAEKHLYFDQVVFNKQTPYQHLVMTRSSTTGDERLFIDGHIQFSSRDEHRYHEYLVHPIMSRPGERKKILILGGGDGMAVREVLKYADVEQVTLVDIDPEMIRIGKQLYPLRKLNKNALLDDRVITVTEDAFSFLNRAGDTFDRIIIDMPDPHNEALNKLYSREFYKMANKRLSPQGFLVTQSSSPFFANRAYWAVRETLKDVFEQGHSYKVSLPSFGIWGFHLVSHHEQDFSDWTFGVDTKAINSDAMKAAGFFESDLLPKSKVESNSIFAPTIYRYYTEDLKS